MFSPEAIADLRRSGISPDDAERAGIESVDDASEIWASFRRDSALVIPYPDPFSEDGVRAFEHEGEDYEFVRVRYLSNRNPAPLGFIKDKPRKYDQPKGSGLHIYLPTVKAFDWHAIVADTQVPIVITEGEKKALAGCLAGIPTVGLGGVANWRERSGGDLHPTLRALGLKDRFVVILFDSDVAVKAEVQRELLSLESALRRHGAKPKVAYFPQNPGDKVGVDDYIVSEGREAYTQLVESAATLSELERAILSLNESVAWIEDLEKVTFVDQMTPDGYPTPISSTSARTGSVLSTTKVPKRVLRRGQFATVEVKLMDEWLVHPMARRYHTCTMDLSTTDADVLTSTGQRAYNLFKGLHSEPGDVQPFLDLTEWIFSELHPDLRHFCLKLMAWKAQNLTRRTNIGMVFIGQQGTGKSLWASMIMRAYGVHGKPITDKTLVDAFNGWLENKLFCLYDEAKPALLTKYNHDIKRLITEPTLDANEKFKVRKTINNYAQFAFTANESAVAALGPDDRRFFVVSTPKKPQSEVADFYGPMWEWQRRPKSGAYLMHYLQNYDLDGWSPPAHAPMTPEKAFTSSTNQSPIVKFAQAVQTNDHPLGIVPLVDEAIKALNVYLVETPKDSYWAGQDIQTVISVLQRWPVRPWYTVEEIAMMAPFVVDANDRKTWEGQHTKLPDLATALFDNGVRLLKNPDNAHGHVYQGQRKKYFILTSRDYWPEAWVDQDTFDAVMSKSPNVAEARAAYASWKQKNAQ